jgi:hypothetical protein
MSSARAALILEVNFTHIAFYLQIICLGKWGTMSGLVLLTLPPS